MDASFKDCTISGGVLNGSVFGDNNTVTNNFAHIKDGSFIECLDEVIKITNDKKEKDCAEKAKRLYVKDKKLLKEYIVDNILTFTTGTFATVAGGLLLSLVQKILKIG